MTALCREHGISRKTGYKMVARHDLLGEVGLIDQSRRPRRSSARTPSELEERILELRHKFPAWGPRKLRAFLVEHHPDVAWPCRSTIAKLLHRRQLVKPPRRRRTTHRFTSPLSHAEAPNDVWCIDYKGQFRLGDRGPYCYPFTVTDAFSRVLLACDGFLSISFEDVQRSLTVAFLSYGLPKAIRSDNGSPFASSRSIFGWTRFTPWLAKLGIVHERIDPGKPQQNGRHERMHRTLKAETTRPAEKTLLAQQERFDRFRDIYNNKRPHQGLGDVTPMSLYRASPRKMPSSVSEIHYPLHDLDRRVVAGGDVRPFRDHNFFLTTALTGERVGLREIDNGRWLVSFATFDLGIYDEPSRKFSPTDGGKQGREKEKN